MPDNNIIIGQELQNIPIGEMIRSMATAVAEAQFELDKSSMVVAEMMGGQRLLRDLDTGQLLDADGKPTNDPKIIDSRVFFGYVYEPDGQGGTRRVPQKASMMELGFVPNFYQFVDTVIEIKIALKLNRAKKSVESKKGDITTRVAGGSGKDEKLVVTTTPVDGTYASSYNYSAEVASVFRTKLVPIPPPAILEERIRGLMEQERAERERKEQETAKAAHLQQTPVTQTDQQILAQGTPSQLPGLTLWLDAFDDTSFAFTDDDKRVGEWRDKSGNNYLAKQIRPDKRPAYKAGAINQKPGVQFNGDDDGLVITHEDAAKGLFLQCPFTVFVLNGYWDKSDGTTLRNEQGNWAAGLFRGDVAFFNEEKVSDSLTAAIGSYYIIAAVDNGTMAQAYVNGQDVTKEKDNSLGNRNPGSLFIGGADKHPNANVGEIIIYNRALSGEEREKVERYLSEKWDIPLT
ncbi:MAG: LamG domain-containing protein [Deltaproteobacteria bacterium]|nr:LamG domain-containing protein [Deltaproteobacteria bacterium]